MAKRAKVFKAGVREKQTLKTVESNLSHSCGDAAASTSPS
jgi:hypothetical protein